MVKSDPETVRNVSPPSELNRSVHISPDESVEAAKGSCSRDPGCSSRTRPVDTIQARGRHMPVLNYTTKRVTIEGKNLEYIDDKIADRKARILMEQLYKDSPRPAGEASFEQGLDAWAADREKHELLRELTFTVPARIIVMNPGYQLTLDRVYALIQGGGTIGTNYNSSLMHIVNGRLVAER